MENRIKASLPRAVCALPQPNFEKICAASVEKMLEHDDITRQPTMFSHAFRQFTPYIAAAAAVFLIFCYGYIFQHARAVTFIEYSVNPTFSISVTRAQTLLEITPLNKDAEDFLVGRNYKGWNIEKALQSLTLSMIEEQYLTTENNTIRLRVSGKSAQVLEQLLLDDLSTLLIAKQIDAIIDIAPTELETNEHLPELSTSSGVASIDDDVNSNIIKDSLEQAEEAIEKAADAEKEALEQAKDAAEDAADAEKDAREQAEEAIEKAADAEKEALEQAKDATEEAADAEKDAREQAQEAAEKAAEAQKEALEQAKDAAEVAADAAKEAREQTDKSG